MWDRGDIWNLFVLVADSPRTFRPSSTFLQPGVCKPHPHSFVGRLCSSELSLLVRRWVICGVFAIVVCYRKGRTPWGLLPWNGEFLSGWRGEIILIKSFPIPGTWTGVVWKESRASNWFSLVATHESLLQKARCCQTKPWSPRSRFAQPHKSRVPVLSAQGSEVAFYLRNSQYGPSRKHAFFKPLPISGRQHSTPVACNYSQWQCLLVLLR